MDTYYFTLPRFLDALDYYIWAIPDVNKLSIGMMNRKDLTTDDYISRFHAIHKSGANMLNMFIAPIDDEWLKYLKRWKNHCKGCPNYGIASCFEPSIECLS